MEPRDYPDPAYPLRTETYIHYFTNRFFYIGIILSAMFLIIILNDDIFSRLEKYLEKRRMKKASERRGSK